MTCLPVIYIVPYYLGTLTLEQMVVSSWNCDTEFLKVGHLAFYLLQQAQISATILFLTGVHLLVLFLLGENSPSILGNCKSKFKLKSRYLYWTFQMSKRL